MYIMPYIIFVYALWCGGNC